MLMPRPPADAQLDALVQRKLAFALYRLPRTVEHHCCVALDGDVRCLAHPSQLPQRSGFVIAPFDAQKELFWIADEGAQLPPPEQFNALAPQPAPHALDNYDSQFDACMAELKSERLQKIVLARSEDQARPEGFSLGAAYYKACQLYAESFVALVHLPDAGTWLCSSPELLLAGSGESWQTVALAGTRRMGESWDAKNREEQLLVVRYMRELFAELAIPFSQRALSTCLAGQLEHLCTHFELRMPAERMCELLAKLPPTPAVCGMPALAARQYLLKNPDMDRAFYAGYLGPISPLGSTSLFVTLRCMQVFDGLCRLYAGGGLLASSHKRTEWEETQLKMQTMRRLITGA